MIQIDTPNLKGTVDNIHDSLKQLLIDGDLIVPVSLSFASLKNDKDRIVFVNDLFKKYGVEVDFKKHRKDDRKSQQLRAQGNQMYKKNEHSRAMDLYNESIAFGSEGSESIAFAYGNRSAILLQQKEYASSLIDIKRAKSGYPSDLLPKLRLRRANCEELLNNNPAPPQITRGQPRELLRGPNDQIPCASAALTLRYTPGWDRHVIAKYNIAPGDVLAIEPAYSTALLHSHQYNRCSNCLSKCLTLIPCTNCPNAMFCDQKCLKEAMEKHHAIECKIGTSINALQLTKVQFISFRTAVRALSDYNWDIEALRAATDDIERLAEVRKDTAGFTKSSEGTMIYDSDSYAPIHCLITNSDKRSPADLFYRSVVANSLLLLVRTHTAIGRSFNEDNAAFFGSIILRHLQTSACNMHTISTLELSQKFEGDIQIGNGAFAFHSLLNHSCSPNVTRYIMKLNRRRVMVTVAVLPIKSGSQIFDNYGFHYAITPRRERREALHSQYLFECTCYACLADYPLYHNLPALMGIPRTVISEDYMDRLKRLDKELAAQKVKDFMTLLAELGNTQPFPNAQVCDLQETAKQCLAILAMDE